ncbi:MAG: hypothetical protein IKX36_04355 [Prevotella sp.]|nr:hypothetical protein [Prevotella sp.]
MKHRLWVILSMFTMLLTLSSSSCDKDDDEDDDAASELSILGVWQEQLKDDKTFSDGIIVVEQNRWVVYGKLRTDVIDQMMASVGKDAPALSADVFYKIREVKIKKIEYSSKDSGKIIVENDREVSVLFRNLTARTVETKGDDPAAKWEALKRLDKMPAVKDLPKEYKTE